MFVSGYGNPFIDDLLHKLDDKSDDAPARALEECVAGYFKKAADNAYDDLLSTVREYLLSNMEDSIRDAVSRTASKVLESALAGDETTFKDFFQWSYDWTPANTFHVNDRLPLGVEFRRKILALHRDLFESKIISDLEGEIAALKKVHATQMQNLQRQINYLTSNTEE